MKWVLKNSKHHQWLFEIVHSRIPLLQSPNNEPVTLHLQLKCYFVAKCLVFGMKYRNLDKKKLFWYFKVILLNHQKGLTKILKYLLDYSSGSWSPILQTELVRFYKHGLIRRVCNLKVKNIIKNSDQPPTRILPNKRP